jgi:chromatin structure-remodeling complex subunit SFH1
MADITNYAEPGEDLDWTKITEPRERKRLQNIINGRKYRERRLAAEGQGGSGGNYPGASGIGSYMSTGYGQRQSLQRAKAAAAQGEGGSMSMSPGASTGMGMGMGNGEQMM